MTSAFDDLTPDWTPNPHRLTFEQTASGINLINADGTLQSVLGGSGAGDHNPAWSPNGSRIAFDTGGEIWTVNSGGVPNLFQVTSGATDADPNWQPVLAPTPPFPTTRLLSVGKSGTGSGSVTSNLVGISCGADCAETYLTGTTVTLFATPNSGSTFGGWTVSGGAVNLAGCATTGACTLQLNGDTVVTAIFNATGTVTTATVPGVPDARCANLGVLCGTNASDELVGGPGINLILGFGGDDLCVGCPAADVINCGPGMDTIRGNAGNDNPGQHGRARPHSGRCRQRSPLWRCRQRHPPRRERERRLLRWSRQ